MDKQSGPVFLFLADGLGLSSAWSGNAVCTAKMPNYQNLWQKYPHLAIKTVDNSNDYQRFKYDPFHNYWKISTGKAALTFKEIIDKDIEDKKFVTQPGVQKILSKMSQNNASLHLIGNLSKSGEYSAHEHLFTLMVAAKANSVSKLYIHLIVDQTFDSAFEVGKELEKIDKKIGTLGIGKVVTVVGQKYAEAGQFGKLLSLYFRNDGKYFLSSSQAIDERIRPEETLPSCYGRGDGKISDFDFVLFFNHNCAPLSNLITNLSSYRNSLKRPKFINVFSLTDFPESSAADADIIYRNQAEEKLIPYLQKFGKSVLKIQPENFGATTDYYFGEGPYFQLPALDSKNKQEFLVKWNNFLTKAAASDFDLVICFLPSIVDSARQGFQSMVFDLELLDSLFPAISELFDNYIHAYFSSSFGMAEKMVANSSEKGSGCKIFSSQNPTPFIIANDIQNSKTKGTDLLMDLISAKNNISFVFTTIVEQLNIGKNN
ncbi:MAG: hypothetical protein WC107_06605 [Patescibacteria group bacterium]